MARSKMSKSEFGRSGRTTASIWPSLLQALAALVVVALGVFGARYLIIMKKPPQRMNPNNLAPLVEAQRLDKRDIEMIVRGYGTVTPKVKVEIVPEVPGKLVYVSPQFKAGGIIAAGEQILQIDKRDYDLAVQQANAIVAEAQVRLDTEKAEAQVAREEWEKLHPDTEPTSPLVLRLPQIRRAESSLESAKAQLATAELKLERTSISLPFDVLIISERADLGQYVVMGQSLGVANGIDSVEIEVPLEDEELAWFDIFDNPTSHNPAKPSAQYTKAQVKANFAGADHVWEGRVVRTTGQVDTTSRMVSVVVEVKEPFDTPGGRPPLLPGIFAEVLILGKTIKDVVAVPRDAVREGNMVWTVIDNRLHIVTLKIIRTDKDFAYVTSELEDGARIITSSLDVVVDGMEVRTREPKKIDEERTAQDGNRPAKSEGN